MTRIARSVLTAGVLALTGLAAPAAAQQPEPAARQVISANPFGLLLELFNAEYERAVSPSATLGVGGSFGPYDDDVTDQERRYVNADAFFRYYPQGRPFDGWNFGVKAGITALDSGTYPGYGFDLNRSWLLGMNDNFYVSAGFGLKRLIGDVADGELELIPTFRIVNVGFAF